MSANFAHWVQDETGDKFLFTIAGPDYADRFRYFARGWMRLRHDTSRLSPVGKMVIVIEPC